MPKTPPVAHFHRHAYPNLKGWLSWDGAFLLGPRYVRLLEGIDRTGTIRGACAESGMSYRTCLKRIRRLEDTLGTAILATHRGGTDRGGSALTPAARQLITIYRDWREEVEQASQHAFARATRRWAHASRPGSAAPIGTA